MEASESTFQKLGSMQAIKMRSQCCSKHGNYESWFLADRWTGCGECVMDEAKRKDAEKLAAMEIERRQLIVTKRLGQAAIPARFVDRTLASYSPTCKQSQDAHAIAKAYAESFGEMQKKGVSLIFSGDVGTGKTHLAIGIANEVLKQGKQPVFTSASRLFRKIKETYHRDSELTEEQAIQLFIDPDLLILDEVGVQFGSETEKMYFFEVINGRYERSKPTILISNLGVADLENFIGTRVMDRLREGGGKAIVFDWQSYRRVA